MGNRAVITTPEMRIGLYLHWNGGRDTVEPLLKYCELQGYRPPSRDCYGWARMAQVMGNYFGGSLSIGIDRYERLGDQGDNGVYVIDGWKIVKRLESVYDDKGHVVGTKDFDPSYEQNEYDFDDMLRSFDQSMPKDLQLGDFLDAEEVSVHDVCIGDRVWLRVFEGIPKLYEVIGFGEGELGRTDVTGLPYVKRYGDDGDYSQNINNYVLDETCRIEPRKNVAAPNQ